MIFTRNAQTNRFSRDCWWRNLQPRKIRFWCIAATTSRTGPGPTGGRTEKISGADTFVPNTVNITASWTSPERWHAFIRHIKEMENKLLNTIYIWLVLFFIVLFFYILERNVFVQWLYGSSFNMRQSDPVQWLNTWNSNNPCLTVNIVIFISLFVLGFFS